MTTIITTTGISLYANTDKNVVKNPSDDQMRQYLRMHPERASAEANSLLQIAEPGDHLVFLHTATAQAERCAKLLKEFFENEGYNHSHIRLVPLQFQEDEQYIESLGLRNLVNTVIAEIEKAQRSGQEVVINATPGFKLESGYSTIIGMLYHVPVRYIYEKFKRVVTLNPIALTWDTSLFLMYDWFFRWIDDVPRTQREVEEHLKEIPEKGAILSFLTLPDTNNEVFLSPLGEAFRKRFQQEPEEAELVDWPATAEEQDIDAKISSSILRLKHHYTANILVACRKIAQLPWVEAIIGGHFEDTILTRIKQVSEDGMIRILWADNKKAANLSVQTTARNSAQTLKVANKIREILEIK